MRSCLYVRSELVQGFGEGVKFFAAVEVGDDLSGFGAASISGEGVVVKVEDEAEVADVFCARAISEKMPKSHSLRRFARIRAKPADRFPERRLPGSCVP